MNGWGALIGLSYGAGAATLLLYPGPWRALRFHRRVHGALHGTSIRRRLGGRSLRLLGTVRQQRIEERQRRAGLRPDASLQVLQCLTGAVIGLAVSAVVLVALLTMQQMRKPFAGVLLMLITAVSGWMIADLRLTQRIRTRQRAAAVALPAFVESIALAVGAGAALPHALRIVSERTTGVLADALKPSLSAGSFDASMSAFVAQFPFPAMTRFVEAVHIAMDRGTPIVDVLHAQAADARQESRRLLLESAGRREVGMLVPVIFFVLPAVVVVALYPGFTELSTLAT